MWNCIWTCLRAIPWWVWAILVAAGAVLGIVAAIVNVLTAGAAITITVILIGAVGGILSALASPLLSCMAQCGRR
jgi:hypothetical protein